MEEKALCPTLAVEPQYKDFWLVDRTAKPSAGRTFVTSDEVPALVAWLLETYPQAFGYVGPSPETILREVREALGTPEGANVVEHARTVASAAAWKSETQVSPCSETASCGEKTDSAKTGIWAPPSVQKALEERSPEWDWFESGGFAVFRQYDESHETRVLARIIKRKEMS